VEICGFFLGNFYSREIFPVELLKIGTVTLNNMVSTILCNPPRADDDDTMGFVQLEDDSKLPMLMYMLHDYKFHGKYLKAEMAYFRFNYMEEYTLIILTCPECKKYGHWLRARERELREMAIQYEIERINNAHVMKRRVMVEEREKVVREDCCSGRRLTQC
jgi:hypothetical protein